MKMAAARLGPQATYHMQCWGPERGVIKRIKKPMAQTVYSDTTNKSATMVVNTVAPGRDPAVEVPLRQMDAWLQIMDSSEIRDGINKAWGQSQG